MSQMRNLNDLMAGIDIADMAGVVPSAVANWRIRHDDFPEPIVIIGRGNLPIFSRRQVLLWLFSHNKLKVVNGELVPNKAS